MTNYDLQCPADDCEFTRKDFENDTAFEIHKGWHMIYQMLRNMKDRMS